MFIGIRLLIEDLRTIFGNKENKLRGHLGGSTSKAAAIIRIIAQLGVSGIILAVCLPAIFEPTQTLVAKEFAAGFVGTVVGFWLK
jgi:hypothetical protein